ncbi:MAG: 2-amino-4-hydroxy-6-hydroxymethyldihydropteridine diphosphokinase [Actinomycetales bacterium]
MQASSTTADRTDDEGVVALPPSEVTALVDTLTDGLRPLRRVVIALGSNLGDRFDTLQAAVEALLETPAIVPVAVSPVYETDAVGGPEGSPPYLNAVLLAETTMSPGSLLQRAMAIESALGRVRAERWGPRTIDVDLLVVGDAVLDEPDLTLPHPRAHERAFVLQPWSDVEPDAVVPGRGSVQDLLAQTDRSGLRPYPHRLVA